MTKPKIRFSEFRDEWKIYLIQDILDRVANPVDVDTDVMYRQIGIRSHGKGIFYKDEVTGLELGNKRVFWIEPDCFIVNIVFAWERAVAKTTDDELGMIASHRFPMYKPVSDKVDLDYLVKYFISKYGNKILTLASPGGAGRNKTLGQDEFLRSKIKLPCYAEQQRIKCFLKMIDEKINLQQNIVHNLEQQMKGVMQKFFSREVKFKNGINFPIWEEKTIKECIDYEQPTQYIVSSQQYDEKYEIPVLTANKAFILGYTNDKDGVYDKGNAIIYDDFTMDIKYVTFPFKVKSSAIKILTPINNNNLHFIYFYLRYLNLRQVEHSRSYISKVETLKIFFPCIDEQDKIAQCLSAFDKKIELEKIILEDWQQIKKGLFQQMLV